MRRPEKETGFDTILGYSTRILLCGDERSEQTALALRAEGAAVIVVGDPDKCLFKAVQRDFDAFILDETLGQRALVELGRELRNIERYRAVPMLALVSQGIEIDVDTLVEAGIDDVVTQPVDARLMVMRVRSLMRRMRLLRTETALRRSLERYVSARTAAHVKHSVLEGAESVPDNRRVCMMFVDVRGSTSLSRETNLDVVFSMISRLLAMQVDCVYRHGGDVDKFGGDGIMAVFEGEGMELNACRCSLELVSLVRHESGMVDGPPLLPVGIGIHVGEVLMGDIGSKEHRDFSVLGETVNLAARLCSEADAGSVLVSGAVRDAAAQAADLRFGSARRIAVRGLDEPVSIHGLRAAEALLPGPALASYDRREAHPCVAAPVRVP